MDLFINKLFTNPEEFFAITLMVVFSICCHEFSHAWMALKQGDSTAADEGHLTLNPFKQMGIMSLLMLAFFGLAFGRVPVNPQRMKHHYSEALVAFAGPAMNLILFFAFCLLTAITHLTGVQAAAVSLILFGAIINMALFLFNLLPVPILDGWAIFRGLFPQIRKIRFEQSEFMKGTAVIAFIMIFMFARYLFIAGVVSAQFVTGLFASLLKAAGMF
ncbi:MAG: site-2 protease family protein [Victivallaceae bacterium]|jgi:Zn-dependent protease